MDSDFDFPVDRNIPVERARRRYPFAVMKVKDSFLTTDESVRAAAAQYGARHGKKFTVSKTREGFRCWRTA